MHVSYQTAVRLKDAGFPQTGLGSHFYFFEDAGKSHYCITSTPEDPLTFPYVMAPTLSEIFEQIPAMYFGFEKHSNNWRAGTLKQGEVDIRVSASTMEETAAQLYIALKHESLV